MAEQTIDKNNVQMDFTPRSYQENIIEICKARNSIVFLPTGAGKTFIAFQIIKHFSKDLEKKYSNGGKRSFFLVNTQVLAKQQQQAAKGVFTYNIAVITGEQNVDTFSESEWLEYLDNNEILVMSAQCFCDGVSRRFINLEQVNVLILDECHHARLSHVYRQIMQHFEGKDMSGCRIIGLSGMLIGVNNKIKPKDVCEEIEKLEATLCSTVITVNSFGDQQSVEWYSTKPKESLINYHALLKQECLNYVCESLAVFNTNLEKIRLDNKVVLNKSLNPTIPGYIKDITNLFKDVVYQSGEMGAYGTFLTLLSVLIQLELWKRFATTEKYRTILTTCITEVERLCSRMRREMKIDEKSTSNIRKNSSPKVVKLLDCLQKAFTNPNREKDLQCLIFTKRRSTAKALYHLIFYYGQFCTSENQLEFPLKPDFVVGQNNELPNDIENIISQSFNKKAIEKFSLKETNCIACTNVLEEGIDLQMCNLVIMYDHPDKLLSFVQTQGRARDSNSDYVILIGNNESDKFLKNQSNWFGVIKELKNQLVGKTLNRQAPTEENIMKEQEQAWEPFQTKNGSKLTALNAITILNQYVQTIPVDKFTSGSAIEWRKICHGEKKDSDISVGIKLPPPSPLSHEIIGDIKENVQLAKQHAAFKTIIQLYKLGELTDSLTAINSEQKIESVQDEYFAHWSKYTNESKKAGTKKHLRNHPIKVPTLLADSTPLANGHNYLYSISIRPKFDTVKFAYLNAFHELLANGKSYGILTSKRLPRLCSMSLFPSYGEVECEIESSPLQVQVDREDDLEKLRKFQKTLFKDVISLWKQFYVIDRSGFVIVPISEDKQIDWKLVNNFQCMLSATKMTRLQAKNMQFKASDYLNKVITKTHIQSSNYVVYKVHEKSNPLTSFPDSSNTYKNYYESKYDQVSITRDDQFLLEVKALSDNFNFFFPGAGASGENLRSYEKRQHSQEILIPELSHNYKFPADYWLKAMLLPCIIHRANYLLLAEELRLKLIEDGIDNGRGQQVYKLDIDYGDYNAREKMIEEKFNDLEPYHRISQQDLQKALNELKEKKNNSNKKSLALKSSQNELLPVDLERDWLNVTAVDIENYASFVSNNSAQNGSANQIPHARPQRRLNTLSLEDSENRKEIKLLKLNGKQSSVQQKDLIKVLTTSNSGDVFDMERFETIGDAFLKFIASLFLFKSHEKWHEGHLTSLKGRMVSNRNLFYIGNDYGLPSMLKTTKFYDGMVGKKYLIGLAPGTKLPLNVELILKTDKNFLTQLLNIELNAEEIESGMMENSKLQSFLKSSQVNNGDFDHTLLPNINEQYVGDKIIADAVEALLGCVVTSVGIDSALKLCGILKILPLQNGKLNTLLTQPILPRTFGDEEATISNLKLLQRTLAGYEIKDKRYFVQALTHCSYPCKSFGTYEQLEFLGDAILDFLITSYISEQCPKKDPGELTDLRSALVNNVTLACIVVRNNLHKFMRYENHMLAEAIKKFVSYQESVEHQVTDLISLFEAEEESSAAAESLDIPKSLGDLFESIVGAIFLDTGLSLSKTWDVIYHLMKNEIHQFISDVPKQVVRRLFEFQSGSANPKFYNPEPIKEEGTVAVPLTFTCRGVEKHILGIGKNKHLAKKAAAKKALIELEKQ